MECTYFVFFKIYVIKFILFAGTLQGMHNIHGSFNVPSMPGTLGSRNSTMNSVPSGAVQQPTGSLSSGRFATNNFPVALSQVLYFSCRINGCNLRRLTLKQKVFL